jgi:hypothetical protein
MFRDHTSEFTDLAALQAGNAPLGVRRAGSQAQADTRNGEYVSGNFFRTFGVQPWAGRLLTEADDQEGAPPVAVMSYRIWKEKYGSDPSVVGTSYQINGHSFTVIGVAAPGFYGAKLAGWGMPDFWLPLTTELLIDGSTSRLKRPNGNFLDLIGRVRPGVDPKTLEAKLRWNSTTGWPARARHGAGRETALAAADAAFDSRRRGVAAMRISTRMAEAAVWQPDAFCWWPAEILRI